MDRSRIPDSDMLISTPQAAIFDLFGTLVPKPEAAGFTRTYAAMAAALGVDSESFDQAWSKLFDQLFSGHFPSTASVVEHICRSLGVSADPQSIAVASEMMRDFARTGLVPRPDVLGTLSTLQRAGIKLGLISNCSSEVPEVWKETPFVGLFDVALFSCTEGLVKPDERIYARAVERLGISPEDCVYLGDGGSFELAGAASVGMTAVLLSAPGELPSEFEQEALEWTGLRISEVSEMV